MKHSISVTDNDPQGYGDGLSDIVVCGCGEEFGEKQEGGFEEACAHLEALIPNSEEAE